MLGIYWLLGLAKTKPMALSVSKNEESLPPSPQKWWLASFSESAL